MHNNPSRPYTYYIICPNWKLYYGYRSANKVSPEEDLWNVYFSSSKLVDELRKQYDDALFVATVDKIFETGDEAREYEEKFLTENGCVKSDFWLNRGNNGKEFCTPEHLSEKTRKKLSIATKGKPKPLRTEKHRENLSKALTGSKNPMYGKTGSKNHMYGKKLPEKTIEKMSIAHRGKKLPEKTIEKREETKRKKRLEDPNYGKSKPASKKNRI